MLAEPMTLYKLMNLYMLKQVNFPLTNAQLSSFFLDRDYTSYFTLQQALTTCWTRDSSARRRFTTAPATRLPRRGRIRWISLEKPFPPLLWRT